MKCGLAVILMILAALAGAGPVLDFRNDLAFQSATVNRFASLAYDKRLARLQGEHKLDRDPALLKRLRGLLARLLPAADYERPGAAKLAWEIHTCRHCGENASAMAGGKLMVGEAFIAQLHPSDAELAYLLAHEMGHVLAEHTREFATSARYFVGMGMQRDYSDIQHEIDESFSLQLRLAPLYRQQELEADYIGFFLGAHAGFRPAGMLSLLHKLGGDSEGRTLLDAHPTTRQRLDQAEAMLPAAERLYAQGLPRR